MKPDPKDIFPVVRKNPLFKGLDPLTLQVMVAESHVVELKKGEPLFLMGDPAHSLFVVLSGWIKLYRVSRTGEEAIISIFGPSESFAEAGVFSDRQMYPVNAQAVEKSEVLAIPRSFFVNKIKEDSNFALKMLGAIAARQNFLVQHMEQITTRSAPQRVGNFLLRFCQESAENAGEMVITIPYDKSVVSTRLNMTPETFSRSIQKLRDYGVSVEGALVTIKSTEQLMDFCDIPQIARMG